MFGSNHCKTETKLMEEMEDAILELDRAQSIPNGFPDKAHSKVTFSRRVWIHHRTTCPLCIKQLIQ
jgi:hypothetical protein